MRKFDDERDIFFKRRFGMFLHWGLYSLPAWHEQVLWRKNIKRKDYEKLIDVFDPRLFDPDAWIDLMEAAGMQYLCFTSKHHDGFCMWDTKYTNYNIMNTPYKKDVLRMLSRACEKRGIPLSIYYSCPDWHHPEYPNRGRHHEMFGARSGEGQDIKKYYEFVKQQVTELCTNYGRIYQFFWDVNVAEYHDPELNEMIRNLQPGILINDRGPSKGDYNTPERHVPDGAVFKEPVEACQALGRESWGYRKDEDYYSTKHIMQSIDKILAMGGNYLLNVGPKADGTIAGEYTDALKVIGNWYKSVKEAFDDTYAVPDMFWEDSYDGISGGEKHVRDRFLTTKKGNTIYIHLYNDIQSSGLILRPFDILPDSAILLNNGQKIDFTVDITPWHFREKPYLRLRNIPVNDFSGEVMIIKLEFSDALNE